MANLQDQLDDITMRTRELLQPERLAISEHAVEELFATGIEERILPVGAQAPEFELVNFNGKTVRLSDLLNFGPVVLKFFRGHWCPYCVTELEAWRELYEVLRERGALLAAISPQTAQQNDFMAGRHELPFPVLADPGCRVATQFGLSWAVPEPLRDYYRAIFVDLAFVNGSQNEVQGWQLPLPATYVLDSTGRVAFAEAHADYRVRPEPDEAMAAVEAALRD
ncbi:MAG: peroxiredoxin-like family protein [Terracidiphilus sp.]|nr:peroxiredoxin-like family protein [Terracidiphilus sp.]